MRNLDYLLKNKIVNSSKLLKYGFIKQEGEYIYKTKVCNDQFEMIVIFSKNKGSSKLIDITSDEEYILVDIQDSAGEYVGKIREEYEIKLNDIIEKCTNPNIFKTKQAKEIIKYINQKYGDELEFLWEKFDDNAICRNKQNDKWYMLILKISKDKLGIDSKEIVEAIDLRYPKEKTAEIIDNERFFPGYHMNKESWITIKLDNSVDTEDIIKLIDISYNISISKR